MKRAKILVKTLAHYTKRPRLAAQQARALLCFGVGALGVLALLGALAGCKPSAAAIAQPTATSETVQITLQNDRYGMSVPVGVLITNTGKKDVYALDGRAACTVLQVQMYAPQQKAWAAVDACHDTVPPHVLVIHAGMSEPFTLAPGSASDPNTWAPGSYRIALAFSMAPDGATATQMAYSQGFTITSGS